MKPLKFKIIPHKEIFDYINDEEFSESTFQEYLNGGRHDIFYNVDIFKENCRSVNETYKKFELFEEVTDIDDETVIVFPLYLELFQYKNKLDLMKQCIDKYATEYKNNKIVFYWNQDIGFERYNDFVEQYDNIHIINYNTSKESKKDIILPFWTLNTKQYIEQKKYNYGFVGDPNAHPVRQALLRTFANKPHFFFGNNIPQNLFYQTCSCFIFNFCPRGAGLSSWRFFESFHLNTIPVLFSDTVVLPYQNRLDYNDICVKIEEDKITDYDYIISVLKSKDINKMLDNINNVRHMFTLQGVQEEIYNRLNE